MARYLRLGEQFLDDSGDPLSGGMLYFVESGAAIAEENYKTTYSDSDQSVANTNPVVLDAAGRSPVDIFFSGSAKIQLTTSLGVQVDLKDPVPALQSAGDPFSNWAGTVTYDEDELVIGSDGRYYRSIITSNLNQNPTSTSNKWERINFLGDYDSAQTYSEGEYARDPADDNLYLSLVNSNTGNTPNSSASQWKVLTAAGNMTGPGSSTDNAVTRFNGTGGTTLQNSGVLIDDSDNVSGVNDLDAEGTITADTINEHTSDAGVTVEGVLLKDSGIYLGGSGAANYLDDYEEGTFTPAFAGGTNPTVTYAAQHGEYTKVGDTVHWWARLQTNSSSGGSGSLKISGLPFTAKSGRDFAASISETYSFASNHPSGARVAGGGTDCFLYYRANSNTTSINSSPTELGTGTSANLIIVGGSYKVA